MHRAQSRRDWSCPEYILPTEYRHPSGRAACPPLRDQSLGQNVGEWGAVANNRPDVRRHFARYYWLS
jgi:hypothetical protein